MVAFGLQQLQGVGTEPFFDADLVGPELAVESGTADRCGQVEAVHNAVQQHLQHGGDDATAAGTARGQPGGLVASENQRGAHGAERSASRRDAISRPLHQPKGIGLARGGAEIIHLVVQQEAAARHEYPIAVGKIEGGGQGHQASLAIRHR